MTEEEFQAALNAAIRAVIQKHYGSVTDDVTEFLIRQDTETALRAVIEVQG